MQSFILGKALLCVGTLDMYITAPRFIKLYNKFVREQNYYISKLFVLLTNDRRTVSSITQWLLSFSPRETYECLSFLRLYAFVRLLRFYLLRGYNHSFNFFRSALMQHNRQTQ